MFTTLFLGAVLAAGLLGQIREALSVDTLEDVAAVSSWLLPFEALYQAGLHGRLGAPRVHAAGPPALRMPLYPR